jgi:hypothetical protein
MIAAFSEMNDRYVGRMSPHIERVLKLRDELTSVYDKAIKGEEFDLHPEIVEGMFRDMAKEMEAMRSPTQAVGEEANLVPDNLVSRTMAETSAEEANPKPEITAQPKSGSTVPEGYEDIFDYIDIQERDRLIGETLSRRKERGIDVHQYQAALDKWSARRLKRGEVSGRLFPKGKPRADSRFEFEIMDPKTGKVYRMDAVNFEEGIIFEIKSDAPGQARKGQEKLDNVYQPLMERLYPRKDGKPWETKVVVYDRAVAEQLLYGE